MNRLRLVLLSWALIVTDGDLHGGEIALIGVATVAGDQADYSGLKGMISDGIPHNRLGGYGSSIAYTGSGNTYILASDRGPHDGASDYKCRFHTFEIAVTPGTRPSVAIMLTGTTLLTSESGNPFVGSFAAVDPNVPAMSRRLDPEGVRVGPNGTVFVSDEYGPFIVEFDRKGKRLRSYPAPAQFMAAKPSGKPDEELPLRNNSGRQPNRGMEGLAISPNGEKLFGIMQSPLIQDGALDKDNKRIGVNCRLLEVDRERHRTREFVYRLDNPANGVSEILAVNDHEFLVLERDSKAGNEAAVKKLFQVDLTGATDVSETASLPSNSMPNEIQPIKKKLFLDLLDPKYHLAGKDFPEKIEGIAFGPDLADGRRLLLVTADNDFIATVPFRVYAFAIDRSELPEFTPQRFDSTK